MLFTVLCYMTCLYIIQSASNALIHTAELRLNVSRVCLSVSLSDICSSLSSERALVSPSECAAIVFSTMECLRFLLLQNVGEEPEQRGIQNMLISEHVSGFRAVCISALLLIRDVFLSQVLLLHSSESSLSCTLLCLSCSVQRF